MLELSTAVGEIDLKYVDESEFCAWSEPSYSYYFRGEQKRLEQSKRRGRRLSITGFLQPLISFVYGLVINGVSRKSYIQMMEQEAADAQKTGYFPLIFWNKWEPGEWNRQKRCVAIRDRFNNFSASDVSSLQAGTMNKLPVICAANCTKLAITFPKEQKDAPEKYLQQLKAIVGGANVPALELSTYAPFSYGNHGGLVLNLNSLLVLEKYLPQESKTNVQIIQGQTQYTNSVGNSTHPIVDEDGIINVTDERIIKFP